MSHYYMDKSLIDISQIDNITSIVSYNALGLSKETTLTGFEIRCDNGYKSKNFRYFTDDKNYIPFVKKIYEYYIEHESEFELDDSISLVIDPSSSKRKIDKDAYYLFSNINRTLCKEKLSHLYENAFMHELSYFGSFKREIESSINIILDELKRVFEITNDEVVIDTNINTFNQNFVIKIKRNGENTIIPVFYEKTDDTEYTFSFGNIFKSSFLKMTIRFLPHKIDVNWTCPKVNLSSFTSYLFNGKVTSTHELYKQNELINHEIQRIDETSALEIDDEDIKAYFEYIDEDINKFVFYVLPSNDIYAIENNTFLENGLKKSYIRMLSFTKFKGNLHINDSYTEELFSKSLIHANGFRTQTTMIKDESGSYLIETVFLDTLFSSGEYKKNFSGKSSYRILRDKEVIELQKLENLEMQKLYLRGEK